MARPSVQVCMHLSSERAQEFFERLANERDSLLAENQQGLRDLLDDFGISILPDHPEEQIDLPPAEVLRDFLDRGPVQNPPWYGPAGYGIFAVALAGGSG